MSTPAPPLLGARGTLVVFGTGAVLLRREGALGRPGLWRERFRFRPMTRGAWDWALGGLVATGALNAAAMAVLGGAVQPAFMTLKSLGPGRYWLLAARRPFWVLNIMGEEVLWAAQRTGNSWTAVVIHAGLNGPGFVAVALGIV